MKTGAMIAAEDLDRAKQVTSKYNAKAVSPLREWERLRSRIEHLTDQRFEENGRIGQEFCRETADLLAVSNSFAHVVSKCLRLLRRVQLRFDNYRLAVELFSLPVSKQQRHAIDFVIKECKELPGEFLTAVSQLSRELRLHGTAQSGRIAMSDYKRLMHPRLINACRDVDCISKRMRCLKSYTAAMQLPLHSRSKM